MKKILARSSSAGSPTVPESPETSTNSVITVLTSMALPGKPVGMMHKRFYLDKVGGLKVVAYQNGYLFSSNVVPVNGINDLGKIIAAISADPRMIVIRGLHQSPKAARVRRLKDDFPEHPQGTPWVMIDFDDIELPDSLDPLSLAAIEHCIAKLPPEFQGVTYYYQHSNSAGILKPDGKPLKAGLNAHVFFWLSRRITGEDLAAHLQSHCIQTGFYEVGLDKGGSVRIRYGIDPSVIKSSIQAHYTAAPEIGVGVKCQLDPRNRQGLVKMDQVEVKVPALPPELCRDVDRMQTTLTDNYKREHGFKSAFLQTKTINGISTVRHLVNPNANLRGGRAFVRGKLSRDEQFFTLYFADESSPGSYYVVKDRPEFARHHGGDRMLLKDLSAGAHAYVRDELKWFTEIPYHDLQLDQRGYLPPLSGFANAKTSLILAPTGSGKTKAAIDWMRSKGGANSLAIYAAPTIALVNQMSSDLRSAGVQCHSYTETGRHNLPSFGVIVTTNKSLKKMLGLVHDACVTHYLVVDEIHMSLDEFMKSRQRNESFENGMSRARQTLLLTGTMTKVQRAKIVNTVGHALGGLTEEHFCRYEFASVKRNPLIIRPSANFDSDFMVLVVSLSEAAKVGLQLPRVVVLPDTSKMRKYRSILEQYGLTPYAHVVSRPENTPGEVEAARVSTLPILIASPLFALGMNFDVEPEILLAKFDYLSADTNQINQAINRANRGQVQCEVRIYGNPIRGAKIRVLDADKLKVEVQALLKAEATLEGLLEEHFQIDPATYGILRQAEKHSQAALSQMVEEDSFQNYEVVIEESVPLVHKDKAEVFKGHGKAAREGYLNAIAEQATRFTSAEDYLRFWKLEQLSTERRDNWLSLDQRVGLEISDEESGVLMALCNLNDPKQVRAVKAVKIKRLFGEIGPWISAQYSRETFLHWAKVESEKTDKLVVLVNKLSAVQAGTLSPKNLAANLTRNKQFCDGILALASDDHEYLSLSQKFSGLTEARRRVKVKGSDAEKSKVQKAGLELLGEVLAPLGVVFARQKVGKKIVVDYDTLIVPATWNLSEMAANLERQAQRLKALPVEQKVPMADGEECDGEKLISLEVCQRCVFIKQNSCALGHPIAWQGDEFEVNLATNCSSFKELKLKLPAQ